MTITRQQLLAIMPNAWARVDTFLPLLNAYMPKYGISNRMRVCHFLAQIAHESGELRYTEEIASGAQYEGRKDLGNTQPGDGVRFRGRGLIQITGRANYRAFGKAVGKEFEKYPEVLSDSNWAVESACWFWKTHGLNELADKDALTLITKRINGGTNGYKSRLMYLGRAKKAIKA